jgi:hypothetical protein
VRQRRTLRAFHQNSRAVTAIMTGAGSAFMSPPKPNAKLI